MSPRFSKRQHESWSQNLHLIGQQLALLWQGGRRREEVRLWAWFVLCEPHAEATGLDQSEFNSPGRAIAEKLYKRRLLIILHFPLLSLKNQLG